MAEQPGASGDPRLEIEEKGSLKLVERLLQNIMAVALLPRAAIAAALIVSGAGNDRVPHLQSKWCRGLRSLFLAATTLDVKMCSKPRLHALLSAED